MFLNSALVCSDFCVRVQVALSLFYRLFPNQPSGINGSARKHGLIEPVGSTEYHISAVVFHDYSRKVLSVMIQ
jgi:hypothetical protein